MDNERRITLDRLKVGILAICFLSTALGFAILKPEWNGAAGSMLRIGVLLTVLWIALPSRKRPAAWANISIWTFILLIGGLFVVARAPWVIIPIVIVLGVLSLFTQTRGGRNDGR